MATLEELGITTPPETYAEALRSWADAVELTEVGAAGRVMREAAEVIAHLADELRRLHDGSAVVLPVDIKHAEAMHLVAAARMSQKS